METELIISEKISSRELKLNNAGATKTAAYAKIVEKLDAKSTIIDKYGDEHISDDNATQLRASELILRLHNDIKPDGATSNVTNNVLMVSSEEMRGYIEEARRLRVVDSKQQTGEIIDVIKYTA